MQWRVKAPTSGREYVCALYRVQTGLELRVSGTEDDVPQTRLFWGSAVEDEIELQSETWKTAVIAKASRRSAPKGRRNDCSHLRSEKH